jgi:hypothetical protein
MSNDMYGALADLKNILSKTEEVIDSADLTPEKADEILTALAPIMETSLENWKEQIDSRIDLIEYLGMQEKKLALDVEYFQKRKSAAQLLQKRLKEQTMKFIQENPGLDFSGTRKKFAVQKNGGKNPIEWKVHLQEMKNIVDPSDVEKFPAEFVERVQMYALKRDAFEGLLAAGGQSEAAEAKDRGVHLRIK